MPSHKKHIAAVKPPTDTVVVKPVVVQDTSKAPSLFINNSLSVKSPKPVIHYTNFDYGVAGLLFSAFVMFVWLYALNRKRLNQVVKAFYINRFANQLARDEFSLGNRVSIFLSALFVITFSLFISQVGTYYGYFREDELILFIKIAVAIIVAYGLKIIGVHLFGYIFQNQKESAEYATTVFLFCNTLGLFMLPMVIVIAFVRQISPAAFIYTGMVIYALFLGIRMLRGVIIGVNSNRVSGFYLFLYLCTLEILPFVIMAKLFILNSK